MENLKHSSVLGSLLFDLELAQNFELGILDLGCGGGPDHIFLQLANLGMKVNYYGFDFNKIEINRLRQMIQNSGFKFYSNKIVTLKNIDTAENSWAKFSAAEASLNLQLSNFTNEEIIDNNLWSHPEVEKESDEISIEEIVSQLSSKINLLKIDLDGPDFGYLQDFFENQSDFPEFASLEINYQGGSKENSNSFHNTDRYMKDLGYKLVAITSRTYSNKALPSNFQYNIFAQTSRGIPYQGDALYYKHAKDKSLQNILREILLLDSFNLEDLACELAIENREVIGSENMMLILDLLTFEVHGKERFESYKEMISQWKTQPSTFFPSTSVTQSKSDFDYQDIRILTLLKLLQSRTIRKMKSFLLRTK
jgi:hypothetical protein